jgi:hypothetical protein
MRTRLVQLLTEQDSQISESLRKNDPRQARIEDLARRSTEGELTEDELAEYTGYVRANKFVAILKRQAQ